MTRKTVENIVCLLYVAVFGTMIVGCTQDALKAHEYHAGDHVVVNIGYAHTRGNQYNLIIVEGTVVESTNSRVDVSFATASLSGWYDREYVEPITK